MGVDVDDDVVDEIKPVTIAEVEAALVNIEEQQEHCMHVVQMSCEEQPIARA